MNAKNTQQLWAQTAAMLLGDRLELAQRKRLVVSFGYGSSHHARGETIQGPGLTKQDVDAVIMIAPTEWHAAGNVLVVLAHELVHAHLGWGRETHSHGEKFARECARVGLEGELWDQPTGFLRQVLQSIEEELPPLPEVTYVVPAERKTQKGRLRLWECSCGVKVRVASDRFLAKCLKCETPFVAGGKQPEQPRADLIAFIEEEIAAK